MVVGFLWLWLWCLVGFFAVVLWVEVVVGSCDRCGGDGFFRSGSGGFFLWQMWWY